MQEAAYFYLHFNCAFFKMHLPLSDKLCIVKHYYENGESVTAALRNYHYERNMRSKHQQLPLSSVQYMINKFLQTGSLNKDKPTGRNKNEDNVERVLDSLPIGSVRSMATASGVPKTSVHRIIKENTDLFPYKKQFDHYIPPNSKIERLEFCNKLLARIEESPDYLHNILFTDESTFDCNIHLNKQNNRIWSPKGDGPPLAANCAVKHFPPKICVWAGFTAQFRIGPYFFNDTVNSANYTDMIATCVIPALKSKRKFSSTVFQQDGATPHTSIHTKEFLRKAFGDNRVISRGFPFGWPGYSPDLTPADFGLWRQQ